MPSVQKADLVLDMPSLIPEQVGATDLPAKADRILTPVLSRTRELQHLDSLAHPPSETGGPTPDAGKASKLKFKATAMAMHGMSHPHMPAHKGGEGVRRLVEAREQDSKLMGYIQTDYWFLSLFSVAGRALPVLPQVVYTVYAAVMVTLIIVCLPQYANADELKALSYPISTLGLALFLLMSFRVNSSYERWWEGRKLWEGIALRVQDISRIAYGWVAAKEEGHESARNMIRWSLAFAYVALRNLRDEKKYPQLVEFLSHDEILELEAEIDPVALVSEKLTAELQSSALEQNLLTPPIYSALDDRIHKLNADLESCQRIQNTPMPMAYIVHLRSFAILWLAGLPFVFCVSLGWWSILVCAVVGYQLLGFEAIAVEIENPFGTDYNDLPLDQICAELSCKVAKTLQKLGKKVDVTPLISADPLKHFHNNHYSGDMDTPCLNQRETSLGNRVMKSSMLSGIRPGSDKHDYAVDDDL